ncbi:YqcC family protein [Bermanella sp. WJH001]|uniref:YqcC family protein n=1 Tax=Bermanella sp. WJH001 TaxID=3048005 RepID=UPI0024BDF689|nr:YqcC family protein [Bermanella sp. WJH001]MDJ1539690.1 YqcC family protein [Bermanella sp. WJH001]
MSDARYQALSDAINHLIEQMQSEQLWSAISPDEHALKSTQPFCLDTLTFEQWLQFVMVPTFLNMIRQRQALPKQCDIEPMAQQVWQQRYLMVQASIKAIDEVISAG